MAIDSEFSSNLFRVNIDPKFVEDGCYLARCKTFKNVQDKLGLNAEAITKLAINGRYVESYESLLTRLFNNNPNNHASKHMPIDPNDKKIPKQLHTFSAEVISTYTAVISCVACPSMHLVTEGIKTDYDSLNSGHFPICQYNTIPDEPKLELEPGSKSNEGGNQASYCSSHQQEHRHSDCDDFREPSGAGEQGIDRPLPLKGVEEGVEENDEERQLAYAVFQSTQEVNKKQEEDKRLQAEEERQFSMAIAASLKEIQPVEPVDNTNLPHNSPSLPDICIEIEPEILGAYGPIP